MIEVIITGITGSEPYNIWVSDNCPNENIQIFINTINDSDIPYTFQIPHPFEGSNFCLKIIDNDNCIICNCT
jgi:hypothetical protein